MVDSLIYWLQYWYRISSVIHHYCGVIKGAMASQITSLAIVYLSVHSGADQGKHRSSASLAFVWGIHRWPVNSPHKWPETRKMFPFDDVIMWRWPLINDRQYGGRAECGIPLAIPRVNLFRAGDAFMGQSTGRNPDGYWQSLLLLNSSLPSAAYLHQRTMSTLLMAGNGLSPVRRHAITRYECWLIVNWTQRTKH